MAAGAKVLIVDDDAHVREMIADCLAGYDVVAAGTYEDARRALLAGGHDVAILDIMGVRGYDLLAEFARAVPCILLTARALKPQDLERAIAGGAALFLPKEELAFLDEYVDEVIARRGKPLWEWLFGRVDFRRWFGPGWSAPPVGG